MKPFNRDDDIGPEDHACVAQLEIVLGDHQVNVDAVGGAHRKLAVHIKTPPRREQTDESDYKACKINSILNGLSTQPI
jgi:hypothetical protein